MDRPNAERTEPALGHLLDVLPHLFLLGGTDGVIRHINPAWTCVLGYPEEALIGRQIQRLVTADSAAALDTMLRRLSEGVDSDRVELSLRCQGEGHKTFVWSAAAIPDASAFCAVAHDVTEQQAAEAAAATANQRFLMLLDAIDSPVYVADMQTYRLLYVNEKVRQHFGAVEGQLCYQVLQNRQDGPCPFCTNDRLLDENGEPTRPYIWDSENSTLGRWFHCIDRAIPWNDGHYVRMEIAIDITDRKRSEDAAAYRADLQSTLAEVSGELLQSADRDVGDVLERSMGAMRRRLGVDCSLLALLDKTSATMSVRHWCSEVGASRGSWRQNIAALPRLMGAWRTGQLLAFGRIDSTSDEMRDELALMGFGDAQSIIVAPLSYAGDLFLVIGFASQRDEHSWNQDEQHAVQVLGNLIGNALGREKAVDALRSSSERLQEAAFNDPLTGLPNRRLLVDRMEQAAAAADRTGALCAVCYLDLDEFKPVNDQCGHEAGDRLLVKVAERLRAGTRPNDTVARWGGDEFALLLTNLPSIEVCAQVLERLRAALEAPYRIQQRDFHVTASMGVSVYPRDGSDGEALLRCADQALYVAKQSGRNRVQFFDPEKDGAALARRLSLIRIEQAIDHEELRLRYQPIFDMRQGRLIGVEALVRWQHPQRGLLGPDAFLPLVEGNDLIHRLDLWVIGKAFADLAGWRDKGLALRLSLNVSARSMTTAGFVDNLTSLLDRYTQIGPADIDLEVRETTALNDVRSIVGVVDEADRQGFSVAIDDFGRNNGLLLSFRQLRAKTLKIDRTLVGGMLSDLADLSLVAAVIGVARAFEQGVIAEGLETPEQGSLLLDLGCDLAQGYFIARPMPADALLEWSKGYSPPEQWAAASTAWTAADLPLLLVEPQHRGWLQGFELALLDRAENALDPPDSMSWPFGRWYALDGQRRYGSYPAFIALGRLQQRLFDVATDLAQRRQRGERITVEMLGDLHDANDALTAQLKALRDEVTVHRTGSQDTRSIAP